MKMKKSKCIKLYQLMIEYGGRPTENILKNFFSTEETIEISRQLNIGKMAAFTDSQLVTMAKKTLEKIM